MTLAEVVYQLFTIRRIPKDEVVASLLELLGPASIEARDKSAVRTALIQFRDRNVDFVDALLAAQTITGGGDIYSFDRDFDRLPGITRIEPP